ncbi:putative sulfate exporter family transporter [Streptomyces sp. RY43-2]|uniref:Sulfate exporter family transporter n=1 Tax=Streptomyces macrolidinus TaxID=2952607 RepID=A0ABT0ZDW9_9ACTN|nr:putative sulfate exporter family transporter [Streptomyces macrolidinus]MCN9241759.1 putative sulfate exporter family transporter [Streptomyces macrolidinus]
MVFAGPERRTSDARRTPSPAAPRRRGAVPGLALAVVGVAVAFAVHALVPAVPTLTVAVVLGVVAAHLPGAAPLVRGVARPGLSLAGKRLMRLGIVLLGLKLSLGDVAGLGWQSLVMVVGVVLITFFGTRWMGRRIGLSDDQSLLVATGYSICGASAIGAVSGVLGKDKGGARHEAEVASSVALVTLCGTLAIAVLPLLRTPLGLDATQFGHWVGASVHDVGQVVATAQTAGPQALTEGVLVKLIRVAMLAPLVAGVALSRRRKNTGHPANGDGHRPALLPLFVVGFLAMVVLRSTGLLGSEVLDAANTAQELLLAAALFGLGSAVHLPTLARTGGARMALLGLGSWLVVGAAAYAGVLLTT